MTSRRDMSHFQIGNQKQREAIPAFILSKGGIWLQIEIKNIPELLRPEKSVVKKQILTVSNLIMTDISKIANYLDEIIDQFSCLYNARVVRMQENVTSGSQYDGITEIKKTAEEIENRMRDIVMCNYFAMVKYPIADFLGDRMNEKSRVSVFVNKPDTERILCSIFNTRVLFNDEIVDLVKIINAVKSLHVKIGTSDWSGSVYIVENPKEIKHSLLAVQVDDMLLFNSEYIKNDANQLSNLKTIEEANSFKDVMVSMRYFDMIRENVEEEQLFSEDYSAFTGEFTESPLYTKKDPDKLFQADVKMCASYVFTQLKNKLEKYLVMVGYDTRENAENHVIVYSTNTKEAARKIRDIAFLDKMYPHVKVGVQKMSRPKP